MGTRAALGALLLAVLAAGPARADGHEVYTLAYNYLPSPHVAIAQGDTLTLTDLDADSHTLTSVATNESGPLFDTPFPGVRFLDTQPVNGVSALGPGTYPFYCAFHFDIPTMRGVLEVV